MGIFIMEPKCNVPYVMWHPLKNGVHQTSNISNNFNGTVQPSQHKPWWVFATHLFAAVNSA
jgi:hypothetical protein